jgi:hypothetical protein
MIRFNSHFFLTRLRFFTFVRNYSNLFLLYVLLRVRNKCYYFYNNNPYLWLADRRGFATCVLMKCSSRYDNKDHAYIREKASVVLAAARTTSGLKCVDLSTHTGYWQLALLGLEAIVT